MQIKNLTFLFLLESFFLSSFLFTNITDAQRELYLGILKNNSTLVNIAFENGADVNLKNPITQNTPLYDSLINLNKLINRKFGWIPRIITITALAIATGNVAYYTNTACLFYSIRHPFNCSSDLAAYLGLISATIAGLNLVFSTKALREKINNAREIVNLILSQPNLVIDSASVEFCEKYISEVKKKLEIILKSKDLGKIK